jgi:hypothetical protein
MSIQGQMLPTTERGVLIKELISKYKPKTIVEIGTWKGMGSTMCILESIDYNCNFISFESNKSFYEIAKNNLTNYQGKVELIYGTLVSVDEVLSFLSDKTLTNEQQSWLKEDINWMKKCEIVFDKIPQKIDFLLLDGGEFSTYSEWEKLKSRTSIVALDDIRVLKTSKIYSELISDDEYKLINETAEGNGFAIFIKK